LRTEGRIKTVKEREEESYGICSGNKLSYEKVSSSCSGQSDKYACETRRNLRIYRQKRSRKNDLHENALRTVHADGRGDSAVWKTGSRNKSIYGADWKSD